MQLESSHFYLTIELIVNSEGHSPAGIVAQHGVCAVGTGQECDADE
jgi:hypothetical protein